MQADLSGNYLFIYSGREPKTMDPETKQVIYKLNDPFSKVHAIRIDCISSVEVDYSEYSIRLFIKGHLYPILCTFGERNCHKINCFYTFLDVIHKALQYDWDKGFNLDKRDNETALSVQPQDIYDNTYNSD